MTHAISITPRRISPAEAASMLAASEQSGFSNRPVSDNTVRKYAHAMRLGDFRGLDTADVIRLGQVDGKTAVLDGQHRLHAIVLSNQPQEVWVAEGLEPEIFKFIDQGKPRTLRDLMTIDGTPLSTNPVVYASTGYMLYKEDHTGSPLEKPEADEADGWGIVLDFLRVNYAEAMSEAWITYQDELRAIQRQGLGASSVWLYVAVRAIAGGHEGEIRDLLQYLSNADVITPPTPLHLSLKTLIREIVAASKDPITKRTMPGANTDLVHNLLYAIAAAWRPIVDKQHLVSWPRVNQTISTVPLKKRVISFDSWPGIR